MRTPQAVVDVMLRLAAPRPNDFLVDLGSGDGRIVITAAKRYGTRGLGVDIDGTLVAEARARAAAAGVAARAWCRTTGTWASDGRMHGSRSPFPTSPSASRGRALSICGWCRRVSPAAGARSCRAKARAYPSSSPSRRPFRISLEKLASRAAGADRTRRGERRAAVLPSRVGREALVLRGPHARRPHRWRDECRWRPAAAAAGVQGAVTAPRDAMPAPTPRRRARLAMLAIRHVPGLSKGGDPVSSRYLRIAVAVGLLAAASVASACPGGAAMKSADGSQQSSSQVAQKR